MLGMAGLDQRLRGRLAMYVEQLLECSYEVCSTNKKYPAILQQAKQEYHCSAFL